MSFDFRANWEEFYKHWQSDAVQYLLNEVVKEYCIQHAEKLQRSIYINHRGDEKPIWSKGQPIWHLADPAKTNFYHWRAYACRAVKSYYEDMTAAQNMYEFRRALLHPYKKKFTVLSTELQRYFLPREGTLESLVWIGGSERLSPVMHHVALQMFGADRISILFHHVHVDGLLFDLESYYFANL